MTTAVPATILPECELCANCIREGLCDVFESIKQVKQSEGLRSDGLCRAWTEKPEEDEAEG